MKKQYSYGKQFIDEEDIQAVVEVLRSDWLTQGPNIEHFEERLRQKLKAQYAAVVSNGTAALHLAGLALGWKEGDIILTSPLTFLATANCILYAGGTPDFVDIDASTYTLDPNKLEEKIKQYLQKGKKVKAVIGVDFAGHPCHWEDLRFLADQYQFQLVDDACHALGAKYKGEVSYSVKSADAAIFSFHPVKHITTGEGGAILSNSKELDEKIKILRTHGMTKSEKYLETQEGPWYYEMHDLGFNYRLTSIQCALGISQLKKLDDFIQKRQKIATYYDQFFAQKESFIIPKAKNDVSHAYHLYPLQIKFTEKGIGKKEFFEKLREKNIFCQVHYIPIHLQPYYRKNFGFSEGDFPLAESFYRREISLPLFPQLEQEDLEYITQSILEALN